MIWVKAPLSITLTKCLQKKFQTFPEQNIQTAK